MKKAKPNFGHTQIDYRIGEVFKRAVSDFEAAYDVSKRADAEYMLKKESHLMPKLFAANARRTEAGVVLLLAAGSLLEEVIYSYAVTFLDAECFEEHLGRTSILTKFLLLPRLCQHKQVLDDHPAINALRELIKARNAIAHHKREEISLDLKRPSERVKKEGERFLQACCKAESTVQALIKLLTAPDPMLTKTSAVKQAT